MNTGGLEQYKRLIRFAFNILLLGCLMVFFIKIWDKNYNDWIVFPFFYKGFLMMGAFYASFFVIFSYILGGMKIGYLKSASLMLSQTLAVLASNFLIYLETVLLSARFVNIIPMVELTVIDIGVTLVWSFAVNGIFRKLFPPRDILVLFQEYDPSDFMKKIKTRGDRFNIKASMNVELGWEEITREILQFDAVFLCDIHSPLRNQLVKFCYANGIRSYITPKISDIIIRSSEMMHLFDTPLLLSRNNGFSFEQKFVKRVMDVIISVIMLVITSPIMLVTAVAIKLYDGGPVFFCQERCTIDGRVFMIHKFRSMVEDAEKDGEVIPASDDDERITPIGKFIRKTRIDELPQFIDILKGDMSVVGPRPERVEHVEQYTKEVPEFAYRLKVKGGLTGYAQVYGKYNTTAYDKLKLDLMYIQNYSFLLDLKLLIMTVKIVFVKESTEGFEDKK